MSGRVIKWNSELALRVRARRLGFELVRVGPSEWHLVGRGARGRFSKLAGPRRRGGFPRTVSAFIECGERWPGWLEDAVSWARGRRS